MKYANSACRLLLCLHALNLSNELGIIAISMLNLFSQRQHPDYGSTKHQEQLSIMLVSIATTVGAFLLTMVGGGSALAGCKVVAARVSVAGSAAFRSRQRMAGSAVCPTTAALMTNSGDLEGAHLGTWLQSGGCMFRCMACMHSMTWCLACAEGGAGDGGRAQGIQLEAQCSFKRDLGLLLSGRLSDPPQL